MHATIYVKLDPTIGRDSGPYDVYTDLDLVLPILMDVPRSYFTTVDGFELQQIDDAATSIVLVSKSDCCTNTTYIPIVDITTTTTTTLAPTTTSTTTSTTTAAPGTTTTSTTSTTTTSLIPPTTTTSTTSTTTTSLIPPTTTTTTTTTSTTTTTTTIVGVLASFEATCSAEVIFNNSSTAHATILVNSDPAAMINNGISNFTPNSVVTANYPAGFTVSRIMLENDVVNFKTDTSVGSFIQYEYHRSSSEGNAVLASGTGITPYNYTVTSGDLTKTNLIFKLIVKATI